MTDLLVPSMPRQEHPRRRPQHPQPTVESRPGSAVRFSTTSDLLVFEPVARSDAAGLWYSECDTDAMRADYRRDALAAQAAVGNRCSLMDAAYKDEDGRIEIFGIEGLVSSALVRRRQACQLDCWIAVLSEQARQDEIGTQDPDMIGAVARRHSRWAGRRARAVGLLQEKYGPQD